MTMTQAESPTSSIAAGAPLHLLLVEDEPDLRNTLRYNLKKLGYRVSEAPNGQAALALITRLEEEQDAPVELIVSDVMMPVMDGIAFCKALRERPGYGDTSLMFLTA